MNYHELYTSGELLRRIRVAYRQLETCDLCPHNCGVNRIKGEVGFCGAGLNPKVASANLHFGEEPPVSGSRGSGTIFLSGCSLKCIFCQNFPISHFANGVELTTKKLSQKMLLLQKRGAHNINFVTPDHYLPQILAALYLAIPLGFNLPILWNCSGFENVTSLELLDKIVSIYLPDMKYSDDNYADTISSAPLYSSTNRAALQEMKRQVGDLVVDDDGMACHGIIVRHLVLPGGVSGTKNTLNWIVDTLGPATHISLMSQYFPAHMAIGDGLMGKKVSREEYDEAVAMLDDFGLECGWVQEFNDDCEY